MQELQKLMDTKQTLDSEISVYRKMLEGDDQKTGLRQLVDQMAQHKVQDTQDTKTTTTTKIKETTSKTNVQRSAKGNVAVAESDPQGKFIVLENANDSKDEVLDEWVLQRKIDGVDKVTYVFPPKFILKAGKRVKIWAKDQGGSNAPPDQLINEQATNWGTGAQMQTILLNKQGEERATYVQRAS